jgi:hypothetical protein
MKHSLVLARCLLPAALLLAVALAILSPAGVKPPAARTPPDDNPHKFHLVFTSSNYDYSITYDPRAADEWLFHSGVLLQTNHP